MSQDLVLKAHFALSQKTPRDGSKFGLGFNYTIEASFPLTPGLASDACAEALKRAVATVDHKALGVDVDFGFEPTTANLCRHLASEIRKVYPAGARVKLIRGDGVTAATDLA